MSAPEKSTTDVAAIWATRLDEGALHASAQAELDAWLAHDERREGALLRAQATLAYLDRARALATFDDLEDEPSYLDVVMRRTVGRRRLLVGGGALSGLAAAAMAGFLIVRTDKVRLETALGEVRRVPLEDGSTIALNTTTRVDVSMAAERRAVSLETGEAWFQVAHDRRRPFVVSAGDVRVRAVGTAFSVQRRATGADVLVTEGVVEAWLVGRINSRVRIAAGEKAFVSDASAAALGDPVTEVTAVSGEVDRALAWRNGELALNGESLGYAVEQLNRYNRRKVVVADPILSREPLVGYFRTTEPEAFGRAAASLVGARVVEDGDEIKLVR